MAHHTVRARVAAAALAAGLAVGPRLLPARADDTAARPRPAMGQLAPAARSDAPPSSRDLVDARADMQRRFRSLLAHAGTAAAARAAAETLLQEAIDEPDRNLKWLMLEESRRLGESAGQALIVSRAIGLAAASYDFDAIDKELRCLQQMPLRGLDAQRAAALATAAGAIATRAEADGRTDKAVAATLLAYRAWQRAGDHEAARRAATRHDGLLRAREPEAATKRAASEQ